MINNLRNNPKDDSIPTAKDMIATLKMKHLWIVMLFIMFTGTFMVFMMDKCFQISIQSYLMKNRTNYVW